MISEKRRNLSASCAASCANQMFLNVVLRRTARKPPGLSTSNLKGSALKGSATGLWILAGASLSRGPTRAMLGFDLCASSPAEPGRIREPLVDNFPFREAERWRAPFRVDARIAQPQPRRLAADARDPTQRPAQLFAPELAERADQRYERRQV